MQFDVIVGNPPYQISAEGTTWTMPVYDYSRWNACSIELSPRDLALITPSRWFTGGLVLEGDFRVRDVEGLAHASDRGQPQALRLLPGRGD